MSNCHKTIFYISIEHQASNLGIEFYIEMVKVITKTS